jgi:hypothetical protein
LGHGNGYRDLKYGYGYGTWLRIRIRYMGGNDAYTLKTHYQWIKNLEREILETNEVPLWVQ